MINLLNGTKFFKIENGELKIIRLINSKNPLKIKAKDCKTKEKIVLTQEQLEEYTRLNYDGIIQFTIVNVGKLDDVIVTLFRKQEISNCDSIPYCICRQSVLDFFANSINKNMNMYGISISKDSTPEGVDYKRFLSCDNIYNTVSIAIYIDDTLDDILSLVNTKLYDNVLYTLFVDHVKYTYKKKQNDSDKKPDIKYKLAQDECDGYCKTLKLLLDNNEFMYDFYTGYNIYPLKLDLSYIEDNGILNNEDRNSLSFLLCKNITNSIVLRYSKDIDLSKIEKEYIMVSDINDILYIIAYDHVGKYHIPVERVESMENIEKLKNIYPQTSSVYEAYELYKYTGKKYIVH